MAIYKNINLTLNFLDENPNAIFIFGENLQKFGKGGAAFLRDHPRAFGFITKKFPDNNDGSFYTSEEYSPVFFEELEKLEALIKASPNKIFYISKLGSGLANKYKIWEKLIQHNLTLKLEKYKNVVFCWRDDLT